MLEESIKNISELYKLYPFLDEVRVIRGNKIISVIGGIESTFSNSVLFLRYLENKKELEVDDIIYQKIQGLNFSELKALIEFIKEEIKSFNGYEGNEKILEDLSERYEIVQKHIELKMRRFLNFDMFM